MYKLKEGTKLIKLQKDIDNEIITRILTILPYNQYMANCYKVGGEDE